MKKQNFIIQAVIVLVVFMLAAPFIGKAVAGDSKPHIVVNMGYRPISPSLDLFVALEKGYFKDEGLTLELHTFRGSSDLTDAVMHGKVNAASQLGMVTQLLPQLRSNKAMVKFIGFTADALDSPMRGPVLLAKKGSGIEAVKDLKGKTVGIFPGANFKIFMEAALSSNGLSLKDVNLAPIAPQEQISAFASVDALLSLDPIVSGLEHKAGAKVLSDRLAARFIFNNFLTSASSVNAEYAKSNPETVLKIERALNHAIDFIRRNPEQTTDILAKYTGLPPKIASTMKPVKYIKRSELKLEELERVCKYLSNVAWLKLKPSLLETKKLLY